MATVFANLRGVFFDSPKIHKFIDQKTKRVFVRFGSFVRRTAQFSMRSRKGSAPKGQPPYAHGRKLLKRLIFFSYDPAAKSVVIGPVRLENTRDKHVPRLMEEGGRVAGLVYGKPVQKQYGGHPFMKPAFDKHTGAIASMYRGNR